MHRFLIAVMMVALAAGAGHAATLCPLAAPTITAVKPGPPGYAGVEDALSALGLTGERTIASGSEAEQRALAVIHEGARHEDPYALNALGVISNRALFGQPRDAAAARSFFERALATGVEAVANGARMNLVSLLFYSEVAADQDRAIALICTAYKDFQFMPAAAALLGEASMSGIGVEKNPTAAIPYLEQALASERPEARAAWLLALGYGRGVFGARDEVRMAAYLKRAAELGYLEANWELGMALLNGRGVPRDETEAFKWVSRGAQGGDPKAMISLAVMHALGQGTPVDAVKAEELYRRAAGHGNAHAMRGLAGMLLFGESARPDPALGVALLEMAARANDPMAPRILQAAREQLQLPPRADIDRAGAQWLAANKLTLESLYADE